LLSLRRPLLFVLGSRLWTRRGLVFVTLAALAVRLVWNLAVHRPLDFAFSDMAGYLERANLMLDKPATRGPWLTLFPFGTHYLVFAVKVVFGRNNRAAIGVAFAVVGALAVAYTYATAGRLSLRPAARRLAGVVLIFYYPWISFGGYVLSEMPFALCVAGAAFHGLRLRDQGRRRDAWWLGVFFAAGAAVRPQILAVAVLLLLHALVRRGAWRRLTVGLAARAAIPIAVVLVFSAIRIHRHNDTWGVVSTNGPLNTVFGRCHNVALAARALDGTGFFGPPPFAALRLYERAHKGTFFKLDPAMGDNLTIQGGHMWDAEPNEDIARACVAKTGTLRQLRYAVTHVAMLWAFNIPWPDQGQKHPWYLFMKLASLGHNVLILPAAVPAMLVAFQRRRARWMIVTIPVLSVVALAVVYFGDTRFRVPYDGLLVVLAALSYQELGLRVRRAIERLRGAAHKRGRSAAGNGASSASRP
jgi:hypothetical protein